MACTGKGVRAPLGKAKEGEDLEGFKNGAGTPKLFPKTIELGMRRLPRRSTGLGGSSGSERALLCLRAGLESLSKVSIPFGMLLLGLFLPNHRSHCH